MASTYRIQIEHSLTSEVRFAPRVSQNFVIDGQDARTLVPLSQGTQPIESLTSVRSSGVAHA